MPKRKVHDTDRPSSPLQPPVSKSRRKTDPSTTPPPPPPPPKHPTSSTLPDPTAITLVETHGDIFAAPENTLLIHACNCEGHWGAGIAKAFHARYPAAYSLYAARCAAHSPSDLVGTALLIPPQQGDAARHYVGCLFTSRGKGRRRDSRADILASTESAFGDLLRQVRAETPAAVWMCKVNSGLFGVPWARTKELVGKMRVDGGLTVTVVERD